MVLLPKLAVWTAAALASLVSPVLAADRIPVTGVKSNSVGMRLNINDLQARGGPAWDLFLLSLKEMYEMDPDDQLSYFQIAGIHGKPYREWNSAGSRRSNGWAGYCPHGEKIFLTWHRPYLALYEQLLVSHARRIAATYPPRVRQQYMQAADSLRVPYWDWAAVQEVPQATVPRSVRVNVPSGQGVRAATIENPLSTFQFPRKALAGQYGSWDSQGRPQIYHCPSPYRYPDLANDNL